MENQATLATPADGAAVLANIRATVIGPRQPIHQIAEALGCSDRAVYMLIDRYRIPFVKLLNRRFADPADIGKAILAEQANTPARGRGRPAKAT